VSRRQNRAGRLADYRAIVFRVWLSDDLSGIVQRRLPAIGLSVATVTNSIMQVAAVPVVAN
jgi:hypothetical protein